MSNLYSIIIDKDRVKLTGELSFATVNNVLQETDTLFDSIALLDIDLAGVIRSDSASLALLVHWIRQANRSNKKLVFHNVPAQMLAIAAASGLDELLPIE